MCSVEVVILTLLPCLQELQPEMHSHPGSYQRWSYQIIPTLDSTATIHKWSVCLQTSSHQCTMACMHQPFAHVPAHHIIGHNWAQTVEIGHGGPSRAPEVDRRRRRYYHWTGYWQRESDWHIAPATSISHQSSSKKFAKLPVDLVECGHKIGYRSPSDISGSSQKS